MRVYTSGPGAGGRVALFRCLPIYPFEARSTAICRPIPLDAPITRATGLVLRSDGVGVAILTGCLVPYELINASESEEEEKLVIAV